MLLEAGIVDNLWIVARLHIRVVNVVRRLHEEVADTTAAVMHHVPFPRQVQHIAFAVRVEHVLVVVDEIGIRA